MRLAGLAGQELHRELRDETKEADQANQPRKNAHDPAATAGAEVPEAIEGRGALFDTSGLFARGGHTAYLDRIVLSLCGGGATSAGWVAPPCALTAEAAPQMRCGWS